VTGDERERREEYGRETGDAAQRGEPIARRPGRRLGAMVSVRISAEELEQVRRAAEAQGLSTSAFLRTAALRAATPEETAPTPASALLTWVAGMTTSTLEAPRQFVPLSTSSDWLTWRVTC